LAGQPQDFGADRLQRRARPGQPWPRARHLRNPDMLVTDTKELLPLFIAGERRLGRGDEGATLYPATGEVVARLRAPSAADVEEAITAADQAFRTSGWAQRKPHERAAVLNKVAALIREL